MLHMSKRAAKKYRYRRYIDIADIFGRKMSISYLFQKGDIDYFHSKTSTRAAAPIATPYATHFRKKNDPFVFVWIITDELTKLFWFSTSLLSSQITM